MNLKQLIFINLLIVLFLIDSWLLFIDGNPVAQFNHAFFILIVNIGSKKID